MKNRIQIRLFHLKRDPVYSIPGDILTNKNNWVYLGNSYVQYSRIKEQLGPSILMSEMAGMVDIKSKELREEYLSYLSRLGEINNFTEWHLSTVAENNTMTNNLFLNICLLNISIDIMEKENENLLFITEDIVLFKQLQKKINLRGYNQLSSCQQHIYSHLLLSRIKNITDLVRNTLGFIKNRSIRKFLFSLYGNKHKVNFNEKKNVIVHTFCDNACFKDNGSFREKYFGELIPSIEKRGYTITYFANINYVTTRFKNIIKWSAKHQNRILFTENLISLGDIIRAAFSSFRLLSVKIPPCKIGKVEASQFIKRQTISDIFSGHCSNSYLYYLWIKNLSKKNNEKNKINFLVDIYEGHVLERALRLSSKQHLTNCKTIGFSHTAFSSNHLSFFSTLSGSNYDNRPDFLLCTGKKYRNIFLANGFAGNNVMVVGDLRGQRSQGNEQDKFQGNRNKIMIALPLLFQDAIELLAKTAESFGRKNMDVFVYKHPLMSIELLLQALPYGLPSNIRIMQESSEHGLTNCSLVITTASNMSVNALKKGLPVVSMKRSTGLSFEPTDWDKSHLISASTPEEICKISIELLADKYTFSEMAIKEREKLARGYLAPVTFQSAIRIFSS